MEISITLELFGEVILVVFALVLFVLGVFTAYFGSGKSRLAGILLLLVGLIVGILYVLYRHMIDPGYFTNIILIPGLAYIGGAIIGAIVAFLLFLLVIMKT
ncbi:MAG: hypothetical protein RXP30_02875 [Thermoplasmata archaeon]|jgi:uncharacterized membrane protein YoaK (UPF0700 family)|nr:hypothetical protein [Thermoplasmata archaeon]MVT12990.1 hypothetical protein [Euryarchaeota archaeon]MVT14952.1 hypothetical protein [Euryarchaeota archaeon]MVT35192.1 hypothetical protein [Euryarchaeota archaeon]